jgi:hypothetical protein
MPILLLLLVSEQDLHVLGLLYSKRLRTRTSSWIVSTVPSVLPLYRKKEEGEREAKRGKIYISLISDRFRTCAGDANSFQGCQVKPVAFEATSLTTRAHCIIYYL